MIMLTVIGFVILGYVVPELISCVKTGRSTHLVNLLTALSFGLISSGMLS